MLCPNCHQPIDADATFCGNCGFKLTPVTNKAINHDQPQVVTPSIPMSSSPTLTEPQAPLPSITNVSTNNAPLTPAPMGHTRLATASLVVGIVGFLGGWLLSFLGAIVGVVAVVLGIVSLRSRRRRFAITGIVLGSLVIISSLVAAAILDHEGFGSDSKKNVAQVTSNLQSITTPCYTVKIPKAMKLTKTPGSCTFQATNATNGELYLVKVLSAPNLNTTDLAAGAQADARNVVGATPGGAIKDQRNGTFAQKPAYTITIAAGDGSTGALDYVYKKMPKGNLLIVMHTQRSGKDYSLSTLEKNWSWQ